MVSQPHSHKKFLFAASTLWVMFLALAPIANSQDRGLNQERNTRTALARASAEWDARFNAADTVGLLALYAPDVVSMPYDAPASRGHAAVRADFISFFSGNVQQRHETHVEDIVISGDLAIERGSYTLRYTPRNGGGEVVETGKHLECRRRIKGRWLIIYEIWNRDHVPGS